ncbi:hypothetical protein Gotri_019626 [Gossypium trilobum]|uniref:Pectinesterase inhibitor domain-containing protein n=1 Tax=Gossypium trilobum TaxID=34281 RepID=A0A7J9EF30_9ROSI|nr:hypothetical protein [Gossypium trilobum]
MVKFRLCLFTISFITLTFTLQPFHVLSDEAMIINVCDKTPDPSLCQTCLNSDPKSKTADVRGLAMIWITCGTRDADKLYNDTYNLYTSTNDTALHNLLDNCWTRFIGARDGIDGAGRVRRDQGSDATKLTITRNVIPMITFCSDLFKNPEVAVPEYIIDETKVPFHVMSDEAMIINVCSKTPNPSLCETCLHSDPKSATADVKGLATISITCGTRDADKLYTDTDNLYMNTKDPALHNLLDNCWWRFLGARDNIDSAGRMLSDKGSDAAKLAITRDAMPMITYCSDLFKKSPTVAVPKNIIDEMNVVSTDCQIILGILSNF